MSEHLLTDEINDYLQGKLSPGDLLKADDHLAVCPLCFEQMAGSRENRPKSSFDLFPDLADAPSHLTYEQLEKYVDEKMDEVDREITDVHLQACPECAGELKSLAEMRSLIADDLQMRKMPQPARPEASESLLQNFLSGKYFFRFGMATLGILLIALLIGVFMFLSRENSDQLIANSSDPNLNQPKNIQSSNENLPVNIEPNINASNNTKTNSNLPPPTPSPAETFPEPYQDEIERVLAANKLNIPAEINQLNNRTGELMSGGTNDIPFALSSPVGKIVQSDRPRFQWRALEGAEGYVINIYDENFNKVASSPQLSGTGWQINKPLSRNRLYLWQVTAVKDGQEIKSPVRPAPDAKFKIIDSATANELARLSRQYPNEHLFLGIMYAKAGLLDEAELEFRKELSRHPGSKQAQRFLQDLRRRK